MANETILIVEDNEKNMKLARDILESRGYQIMAAITAEDGLEQVTKRLPDLVLMDIQLPGMNGIAALGKLREKDATKKIPVIAFTASVMPNDHYQIKEAGFDAFISKPINFKEFLATVAATIEKANS
jgi:two-component system, cell cycle response regulator DivK